MICIDRKENCCGCYACEQICPAKAIVMQPDEEEFEYPKVEIEKCVQCGLCEKVCPERNKAEVSLNTLVYAAYRTDCEKRLQSQSGGMFALLSEEIIRQKGVVYGAAYDSQWNVCHQRAESETELKKLLGSKYSQSKVGSAFSEIKQELVEGQLVLFSGTPCQVQGLVKFLGKKPDNLLLVDLICHGVGSPGVWNAYLSEYLNGDVLEEYVQKDKTKNNAVVFYTPQKGVRVESYDKNVFTRGYSRNLFLRPSCHACSFKGIERCSDISLGDFWGIEKFHADFFDKYGISAVMVHTEHGAKWLKKIENECHFVECTTEMLIKENPSVCSLSAASKKRDLFFKAWKAEGIIKTVKAYTKDPLNVTIRKLYWSINDAVRILAYKLIKGK